MLRNISNHIHLSRITLTIKKKKRGKGHDIKRETTDPALEKLRRRYITWKEKDTCLHGTKFSSSIPLCEYFSNGFLPTTPASLPLDSWTAESELHSPFSQVEEMKEVLPLLAPSLVLSSPDSPPMCDRDPMNQISVFHFHLLGIIPPLAGIEAVILDMSQNNFSAFTKAAWHQGLNFHQVGLQISKY